MAKPMPAAEVEITAELVRALLAGQHPDLASLPVTFLANGWDNAIFRLGDCLLARMPRRALGATIIAHEQRWLPVLAPVLPVRIPAPERVGRPALGYPYPWSVVPFLPGTPAADVLDELDVLDMADGADESGALDIAALATELGTFLAAMHRPAPADAPPNPFRGVPLAKRAGTFEANLPSVADQVDEATVRRAWDDALAAPAYDGPPLWLHGDLHPANILVAGGHVSGIIDFGDITSGDPASDLSVAWMALPLELHKAFLSAYGGVDEGSWRRARGWALALAIVFLAHSADNPQLHRIGRRTLAAVLSDFRAGRS
jgi:aminoglycoside phosphotransferase (APT) family kinase protein